MSNRNIFKNKTIAFANQKGGCGKTTLCTLFADYLSELGIPTMLAVRAHKRA
jgi:chromosome partitioning protein